MTRQPPSALNNAIVTFVVFIVGQMTICFLIGGAPLPDHDLGMTALVFMAGLALGVALTVAMTRKVAGGATSGSLRKTVAEMVIGAELKPVARKRRVAANDNRRRRTAESRRNQNVFPRERAA